MASVSDRYVAKLLGVNLTSLLMTQGITQVKFAQDMGTTPSCVSDWIHGNRMPREDIIYKIAKYFGTSVSALFTDVNSSSFPVAPSSKEKPLLVSSPNGKTSERLVNEYYIANSTQQSDFALLVMTDEMIPTFSKGDILFCQNCNTITSGSIGIFNHKGEHIIKRAFFKANILTLVSDNNRYAPAIYSLSDADAPRLIAKPIIVQHKVDE